MSKPLALLILAMALSGCSGIPLRSLPKLAALQNELLDANPAEFALAIQMDARIKPPAGTVPELQLAIRPARPGAFEVVDKKLPMRLTVTPAGQMGLAPAGKGRHWLVFSLPPESQAELARIQAYFKRLQAEKAHNGGGSVSLGIAQEGLAATDPALADTHWESWLRTFLRQGFFELWTGTPGELRKRAGQA
jgi:hypothetical protein